MLEKYLLTKKEIGKFKLTLNNTLALTCEKITQNPRVFNTVQIKNAIENISLVDIEERILPDILVKSIDFILKDFFLQMHQTGLYNRQFNLWSTLANISQVLIFKLQKGIFKKKDLSAYLIDFSIEARTPCISAIINESDENKYKDFKLYLSKTISYRSSNRLKGIFYFIKSNIDDDFIRRIIALTNSVDSISKYESRIQDTKDVRLNLITYKKENEKLVFEHIYPELKSAKDSEIKVL